MRITGGNNKQGFPMRQGILTNTRVRLLMHKGHKGYRQRRAGERKRKSIRGCIVGQDIAVLNLAIVKIASVLRNKEDAAAYKKLIAQRTAEQKEARRSLISKRRSTRRSQKIAEA